MQFRLRLRVLRQQIPRPGQRIGGRFVSRQKDGHCFIAQLLVSHAAPVALFILGQQQHRKQIATIFAARASLFDQAIDNRIEFCFRIVKATYLWQRQLLQQVKERDRDRVEEVHRHVHRFAHIL